MRSPKLALIYHAAVLLTAFSAAGKAVTIPIGSSNTAGVHSFSTGINNTTLGLIGARASDPDWRFYLGSYTSASTAYVTRANRPPISSGAWAGNDSFSQWLSHTRNASGSTPGCCALPTSPQTSITAALTFRIPAMTNPPNLPQWWLVMSGLVWGDDRVTGFALYQGTTPFGTPVYSYSYSAPFPGPLTPQSFSLQTWVNPNQQYTLAFYLQNTADTVTGFRLRMTEAYVTPEPSAWALMLTAGAGLAFAAWRRRASAMRSERN
jgi:hypothetical protein